MNSFIKDQASGSLSPNGSSVLEQSIYRCERGVQLMIRFHGPQACKCSANLSQEGDPTQTLELVGNEGRKLQDAHCLRTSV